MSKPKLHLFDGNSFLFRAYFALPSLTRSDHVPVGAVLGFANLLHSQVYDSDCAAWAVAFDTRAPTFRHKLFKPYKQNRDAAPDDLVPQFALAREAVAAYGIPCAEQDGWEADDLIASYAVQAAKAGYRVRIFGSDKDLLQLLDDDIEIFDPIKQKVLGADHVVEKFGVTPDLMIDLQSLVGDSTDNIPGVPGIGPKTAALLLNEYGSLEAVLENAHNIKQNKRRESIIAHKDDALMARRLVTLARDAACPLSLEQLKRQPLDEDGLLKYLEKMEFTRLVSRIKQRSLLGSDLGAKSGAGAGGKSAAQGSQGSQGARDAAGSQNQSQNQIAAAVRSWSDPKVTILSSSDALEQWLKKHVKHQLALELVALATLPRHSAKVVALAIAGDADDAVDVGFIRLSGGDDAGLIACLGAWCASAGVMKVVYDSASQSALLANLGINHVTPLHSVLLMAGSLSAGSMDSTLEAMSEQYLEHKLTKLSEVLGSGKSRTSLEQLSDEALADYLAARAAATILVFNQVKRRLIDAGVFRVYAHIDLPLVKVLLACERRGIALDRKVILKARTSFQQELAAREKAIFAAAGREFSIASPKQLGEVLFDEMNLESVSKTAKGQRSTDQSTLESLAIAGHAIARDVLVWRHNQKLIATYCDNLLELSENNARIHTEFHATGSQTGRISSSNPNLQNIPVRTSEGRLIRSAFIAQEGKVFLSLDYSQIELRLLAAIADISTLKKAFADGEDIHQSTGDAIFGQEGDAKERRTRAKAVNFGIIYGISPYGLARQLLIDNSEAKMIIDSYFQRFPGIKRFMENTKIKARESGYVETLFGRRLYLPQASSPKRALREFAERQAVNAPIQGTAADIIKVAMRRAHDFLASSDFDTRLQLQIHDELLFSAPVGEVDRVAPLLADIMRDACKPMASNAIKEGIKLEVEVSTGDSWDLQK